MAKGKRFDREFCIYCGDPATTKDHVPPKKWVRLFLKARSFPTDTRVVVPCCASCNGILNAHPLFTIAERRAFVRTYLWRKHAKLIASPGWREAELQELGPGLQKFVRNTQVRKQHILHRIGMTAT